MTHRYSHGQFVLASWARMTTIAVMVGVPASAIPNRPTDSELTSVMTVVYAGASFCGPCKSPELRDAVFAAIEALRGRAKDQHQGFRVIGIATDGEVDTGVAYLKEHRWRFDEIIVGALWQNLGITEYITRDSSAKLGLPQVIVVEEVFAES